MGLSVQTLWALCALGTAIFAAASGGGILVAAGLLCGFACGAGVFQGGALPDAGWTGGVVAVASGLLLFRPAWIFLAGLTAGLLAGMMSGLLQASGVPMMASTPLSALLPVVSLLLARRNPGFAPLQIREEALLFLLVLGLFASVVPAVMEGWRSAGALNAATENLNRGIPLWTLALAGASVMLGGAWSLWRHR